MHVHEVEALPPPQLVELGVEGGAHHQVHEGALEGDEQGGAEAHDPDALEAGQRRVGVGGRVADVQRPAGDDGDSWPRRASAAAECPTCSLTPPKRG